MEGSPGTQQYAELLTSLMARANRRGDRYILCPGCTCAEAAGSELDMLCIHAALRKNRPSSVWMEDNTKLVCCAVNQVVRNAEETEEHVKLQLEVLCVMLRNKEAGRQVTAGLQ